MLLVVLLGADRVAVAEFIEVAGQHSRADPLAHDRKGQSLSDGRILPCGIGLAHQLLCESRFAVLQFCRLLQQPETEFAGKLASVECIAEPVPMRAVRFVRYLAPQPRKIDFLLCMRPALEPLSDVMSLILPQIKSDLRASGHFEPVEKALGVERLTECVKAPSEE